MRLKSLSGLFAAALISGAAAAEEAVDWSYDGITNGQDIWGELSPAFGACEIGTAQSPIVIAFTTISDLKPLAFKYGEIDAVATRTYNGLHMTVEGDNVITVDGTGYLLKRIEFHSPNEHTLGDKLYMLEIHLMHESMDGKKLNVAVFVDSGTENSNLNKTLELVPEKIGDSRKGRINPVALLPLSLGYYAYTGSLTSPPCTEGVEWRVLKKPVILSRAQIDAIIQATGRNSRLEQPVYNRTILESSY